MNKFFTLISLLLILLPSCKQEDDPQPLIDDFAGFYYKITAIESKAALDLNGDKLPSTHILDEISGLHVTSGGLIGNFYDPDNVSNYAMVYPFEGHANDFRYIDFHFPVQGIGYLDDDNQTDPFLRYYEKRFDGFLYELDADDKITITDGRPEYTSEYGTVISVRRINTDAFEAIMEVKIFDFATEKWTMADITVTYRKVPDPF